MKAVSKQTRYFRYIPEEITMSNNWGEKPNTGKGCWLSLNDDNSNHIIQGKRNSINGWQIIKTNIEGGLVKARKLPIYVELAPIGVFSLETLEGPQVYDNSLGTGYIVYNTIKGYKVEKDKWFMTKEEFDLKYKFEETLSLEL